MASRRLHGEVLVTDFHLAPEVVDGALRRQMALRLSALEALPDARVSFRVAVRRPRSPRGRAPGRPGLPSRAAPPQDRGALPVPMAEQSACAVLGVAPGANRASIKSAYRRAARLAHPDSHPGASAEEQRALAARFTRVTEAYRVLEEAAADAAPSASRA